jgi:hypothetical protein
MSLAASSSTSSFSASRDLELARCACARRPVLEHACSCCCISSMPGGAMISTPIGSARLDLDLASSSLPSRSILRNFWRACRHRAAARLIGGKAHHARLGQQRVEHALLGGILGARARTLRHLLLARHLDGDSTRSLMIESTSRPT